MSWNGTYRPKPDPQTAHRPMYNQHTEENPFSPLHKQPSQARRSRSLCTLLQAWKWEFASWLLGSGAFLTITALLILYRDRSLKEWNADIRLATVVAALSQLTQTALLFTVSACIGQLKWHWLRRNRTAADIGKFEEASRGPKGSLMLLPRTRLHLVSVGALATILLLAFSTFTQQSNTIRIRNVGLSGQLSNATISRSVQYRNQGWETTLMPLQDTRPFNTTRTGQSNFHPHMSKAILSGILEDTVTLSDVKGNCSAEACKWDEYTTLAVCTNVEEISSSFDIRVKDATNSIARIIGADWKPPAQPDTLDTFWMTAPFQNPYNITENGSMSLTDIYLAYYPPCNEQNESRGDDWSAQRLIAANWKAFKATFSLCLQTLNSSYSNNTMQTTIVETHGDLKWTANSTITDQSMICLSQPFEGLDFCVGADNLGQWASSLSRNWEGAALLQRGADNYYTGQWVPSIVGDILGPTPTLCDPDMGQGYGFNSFKRRANNIGIAMTNALRTGSTDSPDSHVKGSEWNSEQYIGVDFVWLTFPAAVYLAITVFFFATIVKSRKGDEPLWKSSPLVLLQVADRNNRLNTLEKEHKDAKQAQVQLQFTGQNWHLQDVTGRRT